MNTHLRRISGCLALLIALLAASACSSLPYKTEAKEISAIAGRISGYALPQGYSEQFALDMLDYQLVSMQGPTANCHLYLVQAPEDTEVDIAKLQEQARSMEGEKNRDSVRDLRVVETRTITLRGEPVSLLVSEGVNSDEQPYREATALFAGRNGPALVSISAPIDRWNWDLVDEFLASLS